MSRRGYDMGEFGDLADYGEWNPLWGFVGGGAVTGASMLTFKAIGAKHPDLAKHAGLWGAGVGLVASGIAMIPQHTRRAGYLGAVAAVLVSLPEVIRSMILVPKGLGDSYEDMGYYASEFAAPEMTPALEILNAPPMMGPPAPVGILQGYGGMGYTTADFAGSQLAGVNW